MGRKKIVRRKAILRYLEEGVRRNKGRKKPWQPRGESMPSTKVHIPKKGSYKRNKFNWKEADLEDNYVNDQ